MTNEVLCERREGICILSLNRPDKLNAINAAMIDALNAALAKALTSATDRVILLRGEGRAFCAGNDLEASQEQAAVEVTTAQVSDHAAKLQAISRRLLLGGKPVVGAIHGWAAGAGFEWALNCDLTVWGRSTRAFFPELSLGLFPTGGALSLLPRFVGLAKAQEMMLLGEQYDAETLRELGLAGRVVADEAVFEEALSLARRLTALPPQAVARWKKALYTAATTSIEDTLDLEATALVEAICDMTSHAQTLND